MIKKFGDVTIRELANMGPIICDCCPLAYYDEQGKTRRLCDLFNICLTDISYGERALLEREVNIKPLKEV